jgi:hypothetical protein
LDKEHTTKLQPLPKSIASAEEAAAAMLNAQYLMLFIQLNLMIYQILLSKSLQDLWAMLNAQ